MRRWGRRTFNVNSSTQAAGSCTRCCMAGRLPRRSRGRRPLRARGGGLRAPPQGAMDIPRRALEIPRQGKGRDPVAIGRSALWTTSPSEKLGSIFPEGSVAHVEVRMPLLTFQHRVNQMMSQMMAMEACNELLRFAGRPTETSLNSAYRACEDLLSSSQFRYFRALNDEANVAKHNRGKGRSRGKTRPSESRGSGSKGKAMLAEFLAQAEAENNRLAAGGAFARTWRTRPGPSPRAGKRQQCPYEHLDPKKNDRGSNFEFWPKWAFFWSRTRE